MSSASPGKSILRSRYLIIVFFVSAACQAATLHVPGDYSTIQEAINAAVNGDTVLVAPGTYVENIDFIGKAITVQSSDGAEVTVIDANQSGRGVGFISGEGQDSVLDGFTITNGKIGFGGGIFCDSSSPTITNNIISNNRAKFKYVGFGGGILCREYSNPTITNNTIIGNTADSEGGGILCRRFSHPTIINNTITGNEAINGGGIYCNYNSTLTITNNTITGNKASYGGGIWCYNSAAAIANTILWDNYPDEIDDDGKPLVFYSNVKGGCSGTGNIDADPLFVDPLNNDYHLSHSSPCRDTGDNHAPRIPATDFEGDPRIAAGRADMGADEFYNYLNVPGTYFTIQGAIDAAPEGYGVLVAPGTYMENIDFNGKATVVDGFHGPDATVIDGVQSGSVVTFQSGEDKDSILEGFTLTNGAALQGGGAICLNASPTLRDIKIIGNTSTGVGGGGIYCLDADPIVVNACICGNAAASGGGIFSSPGSEPIITNSVIYENAASNEGGGIHCGNGSPVITNSIIWLNTAPTGPQIQGTHPTLTHCDVQGGWSGTGNIDADPLFEDPGLRDFHLSKESPCIDQGDNHAPTLPWTDFDGDPRICLIVDMGVDEVIGGYEILVPDDFATIQEGIDFAGPNDTVLVSPGTYVESIDFKGKPITVKSLEGAGVTVIDGNQAGSVVYFWNREGKGSILDGFTITNGIGTKWPYHFPNGGGIHIRPSDSGPTIRNNIITACTAADGGGIYCHSSAPNITGNTIANNGAWHGAGIACLDYASPRIVGNSIVDNHGDPGCASIYCAYRSSAIIMDNEIGNNLEGGIFALYSCVMIEHNRIYGNKSTHCYGGGISINEPDRPCIIRGNLIYDNSAFSGGGICIAATFFHEVLIINNTIFRNSTQQLGEGGGIYMYLSKAYVANTVLYHNSSPTGPEIFLPWTPYSCELTISHSNVHGGMNSIYVGEGSIFHWGPGMMVEDPTFADPANGDFHLLKGSPCIDRGLHNDMYPLAETDLEGDPRIFPGNGIGWLAGLPHGGAVVDIGADEYCLLKRQMYRDR